MDEPPAIVNVVIQKQHANSNILQQELDIVHNLLAHCAIETTDSGDHVIPLFPATSDGSSSSYAKPFYLKKTECLLPGKIGLYDASKVFLSSIFPYDLGFAITVHKAQGRTLPKVILCLTYRPNHINQMTLNSIYVALSRVKFRSDIRILSHDSILIPEHFSYMTSMPLNTYIPSFLHGFQNLDPWNGDAASLHLQKILHLH